MFGLIFVSYGQNEGPLNNGSDIYCSACSPLVWNNISLLHMYCTSGTKLQTRRQTQQAHHISVVN